MQKEGIPVFAGKDFPVWKMVIEQYLAVKGFKKFLSEAPDLKQAESVAKDQEALSIITRSLDFKHARLVLCCKTAKAAWDKLCQVHEQKSEASKIGLQRQFFALKMEKEESVAEYVSRVEYIKGQLDDVGMPVAEATTVAKIVSSLPPAYKSFCTQWGSALSDQQKIYILLDRLPEEEALQNAHRRNPKEGVAVNADSQAKKDKAKGSGNSKKNRGKEKGKGKGKGENCFSCGKEGHWAKQCPDKGKEFKASDSKPEESKGQKTTAAVVAESNLIEVDPDQWILDSGATEHMSHDRDSFTNYKELSPSKPVRVGNRAVIHAVGVGDIRVRSQLSDGSIRELVLKNVLHVPKIWRRLFSISATTLRGNSASVERDRFVIKDAEDQELIVANRAGGLWTADVQELDSEANVAASDELGLWHERFGHINNQRLVKMAKSEAVEGLNSIAGAKPRDNGGRCSIDCEPCRKGKQPRQHFGSSSQPKATRVGDWIHADTCGPIAPTTLGGSNYFVLFKDEFSSFRHVYFVKGKGEVHDVLRKCVAAYRGELHVAMKCLVTDHGSEFTSNRTQEFLLDQVIHHSMSAPFTPAQNGLIERDNRTVLESARSMLAARRLPHSLWGEAVMIAVYLLNRSINVRSDITPYEVVHGRKPRATHLRIFGSLAYVKEQEKKRSGYQKKLDDRSRPMMMVGYDRDYTYRVYDPTKKIVLVSREVQFDETEEQQGSSVPHGTDEPERWSEEEQFTAFQEILQDPAEESDSDTVPGDSTPEESEAGDDSQSGGNTVQDEDSEQSRYLDVDEPASPPPPPLAIEDAPQPEPDTGAARYNLRPRGPRSQNLLSDKSKNIIIALYVDDGLIFTNSEPLLANVLAHLRSRFEITVGDATSYVGLQIEHHRDAICLHQSHYIERKAQQVGVDQPTAVTTPLHVSTRYCKSGLVGGDEEETVDVPYRQLIGTLMYAANGTRPDIAYAVCSLSRFNEEPKGSHWTAAKRVMRYLVRALERRIMYTRREEGLDVVCYSDADHGGDRDDRKSTSGILILCKGAPIVWRSTKQSKIANSKAVAEFVAAAQASREVTWLRNMFTELGIKPKGPTPLKMDNQTAITLIANNQVNAKTKSLDIDLLTMRDLHGDEIEVSYVPSEEQTADYLNKPFNPTHFNKLLDTSGLRAGKTLKKISSASMAIMLSVCLVLVISAPAYARTYRQPYEIQVRLANLCHAFKGDTEWNAFQLKRCTEMWQQTLWLLHNLPKCVNRSQKRSVPDMLEAMAPKITWVAAYNFLLQQGERAVGGTPNGIGLKILKVIGDIAFKRFVVDARSRTIDELKVDTLAISESASEHANETVLAIGSYAHPLESLRNRYLSEVLAGNAMIMALHNECERGHIDTSVLAELAGQPEQSEISPASTTVLSVEYDEVGSLLTVAFETTVHESWTADVNWTVWITAIAMFIAVCAILGIAYYIRGQMHQVAEEANRTQQSVRRSSSFHQFTMSHVRNLATVRSTRSFCAPPRVPIRQSNLAPGGLELAGLAPSDTSPSGGVVNAVADTRVAMGEAALSGMAVRTASVDSQSGGTDHLTMVVHAPPPLDEAPRHNYVL